MARLLLIALIAYLIYWLLRRAHPLPPPRERPWNSQNNSTQGILMRRCAQCGIHIPDNEAVAAQGRYFCCAAHRDQFYRQGS